MAIDRSVRSSQLITPFGPGAILDIGEESLLLTDLAGWPKNLEAIKLDRLTRLLRKKLKAPPHKEEYGSNNYKHSISAIRFPKWMFCPNCRHMVRWGKSSQQRLKDELEDKPTCPYEKCKKRVLVPMRFVVACEEGHLDDVPWDIWAHAASKGNHCESKANYLYFITDSNKGSGLDALRVECKSCGASRNFEMLTSPSALSNIGLSCTGRQPWQKMQLGTCTATPVVLQRGASNLYFPVVRSALDIPIDNSRVDSSITEKIKSNSLFDEYINRLSIDKNSAELLAKIITNEENCTLEDLEHAASNESHQTPSDTKVPIDHYEIQEAEWSFLISENIESHRENTFSARVEHGFHQATQWDLEKKFDRIVLLDRLREVRAFLGFERVNPGGNTLVSPSGNNDINWLPAIEVYGEGIFFQFSESEMEQWERKEADFISSRIDPIKKRYDEGQVNYLDTPTPRLLLIHTFAHLMIRQLSFQSGYSSGSIRERIYAAENQAGVLIYTADSDSEGSLGGLVQQGQVDKLNATIAAALETACWCSNDPVCSEMETQGVMGLNKAACHSCSLVSETSCTMNNLLLDRKLLLGDVSGEGYFTSTIRQIRATEGTSFSHEDA
ncbi:conserved hypothetical protein [Hahella chejuensis KCTC 2396]|uniref:MrfA-like Zn-binding domain-containing protein n=1 Tax=Hahella chejuensis (strain KCTC 2396) TaxID=349521 RepID=Q2SAF5_HAHCH|nr:DUF1998 domain-containing protein [Hahella chejuensis]ABC32369.1 conserved hypothetical protein [Hahella chejuensis KCTC 2396]